MENVRISVLSAYDAVCAFLDNKANDAMHFYDDELHQYLKGAANTYTFKTDAQHEKSIHLVEGNKLSFRYRNKDFYFNIMRVVRSEYVVEVESYSLNFELLNENKDAYKAPRAMSIAEYLDVFDFENVLTLKINEVSDKRITHEWTGTETMLARIFSLATVFDSEAEFVPELNDDYSLKRIIINLYRKNSDSDQGIGRVRTDIKLLYGVNISGVTKTSSITDLYTSIRPVGKDGLMIYNLDKTEYDASGKIEFRSPPGDGCIRAVQARDMFPSNLMSPSDRYITEDWSYDTNNLNVLYGQALAQLRKNCVPQVEYEVDGYVDTDVGDTVMIDDAAYNPHLYLQARVVEQIRSFTNPVTNKTKFNNFKELQSQIDPFLLQKMNDLIAANKEYTCSMLSDNGIVFKNGEGSTKLTASIMDVGKDVTGNFTIRWLKDGTQVATGKSVTVNANDISGKAVYKYEATDSKGTLRAYYEVTVANVLDGAAGDAGADAYTLYLSKTSYMFNADHEGNVAKNISVSTDVIAYKGNKQIIPLIGTLPTISGMTFDVYGSKITITARSGKSLSDNGTVDIPVVMDGIACTLSFSYVKVRDGVPGSDSQLCNITGVQIMKYASGSTTPDPSSLTLNAEYKNATHYKWQYKNELDEWKDFTPAETSKTIDIKENSEAWLNSTAVVRAVDTTQMISDTTTLAKLRDGSDAILLYIDSVNGYTFKNTGVSTIMTVTIIVGDSTIDTSQKMYEVFGAGASIIWECKRFGETVFTRLDADDTRISDNGFILTLIPQDVDIKSTFTCSLDY